VIVFVLTQFLLGTHTSRWESSLRSSTDVRGSHRPITKKATSPLLVNNDVIFQSPREEDQVSPYNQ